MARAVIGAGDLPMLARAERVTLHLTRSSVELACHALGQILEEIETMIAEAATRPLDAYQESDRRGRVADRIAIIDALAELRGQR